MVEHHRGLPLHLQHYAGCLTHFTANTCTESADLMQEAAEQVQKVLGDKGLDVLINNAGTSEDLVAPLDT